MSVGYSGTPLAKKLGIKPGIKLCVIGVPNNYDELLAPLPVGVVRARRLDDTVDVLHIFSTSLRALEGKLKESLPKLRADAAIWVSWPKKTSKVTTDITEDRIRDVALPVGLVDIKVCAVDAVWSGLKLVVRKELRESMPAKPKRPMASKSKV
jgi:hypothetical protein